MASKDIMGKELSKTIHDKWSGAGVLPFARVNNTNDIYLLLGKEDVIPNWSFGSNKWCEFSGGREDSDQNIEETAAREFYEESLACEPLWPNNNTDPKNSKNPRDYCPWKSFATALQEKKYTYRFDRSRTDSKSSTRSTKRYACFLVEIPFQPNITKEFDKVRSRLVKLRNLSRLWQNALQHCPDPDIVPGSKITATTKLFADQLANIGKMKSKGSFHLVNISVHKNDTVLKLRVSKTSSKSSDQFVVDIDKPISDFPDDKQGNIVRFAKLWTSLLEEFRSLPYALRKHPAVSVLRVPSSTYVYDIRVLDCYMEKQRVSWWSLPWLKEGLHHGGAFRMELFRGAFAPFLSVVIDLFHGAGPGRFVVDVRPWTSASSFGTHCKYLRHEPEIVETLEPESPEIDETVDSESPKIIEVANNDE